MALSKDDLSTCMAAARQAALQAGRYIRQQLDEEVITHRKEGGDSIASQVVTEVDFQSEKIILAAIASCQKQFGFGLLTEEQEDDNSRFERDYFWCIDPLDGTLAFTEKREGFAVSLSLVSSGGEAVLGVAYDPYNDVLWQGHHGVNLTRNHKPWQPPTVGSRLSVFADRGFSEHDLYQTAMGVVAEVKKDLGFRGIDVMGGGGAVMNALWALEKGPSCYFKFPKEKPGGGCSWDFAATSLLYKLGGGAVGDIWGQPLDLNPKESLYMNRRGVLYASDPLLRGKLVEAFSSIL